MWLEHKIKTLPHHFKKQCCRYLASAATFIIDICRRAE